MNWDELVENLGPRLFRYFRMSFTDSDSSDGVQDVLLRLFRLVNEGRFDGERATLTTVAFGIAHNVRRELLRGQRRHASADDATAIDDRPDTSMSSPEDLAARTQQYAHLVAAIKHTSETEQEVLALLIDQDLDLPQIAAILGMPVGTVKSHVSRAKEKIKTLLIRKETP